MEVRAFVKKTSGIRDARIESIKLGEMLPNEVLVKVNAVGICGSDLHMYAGHNGYDWVQYPLVLGHEITGTVVEAFSNQAQHLVGKRVVVNPYEPCGSCEHCKKGNINRCEFGEFTQNKMPSKALQYGFRKPGGLAEYMKVKAANVIVIEDAVSDQVAAISEALAVSYTAVKKVERFSKKKILVVGPGPIGLGVVALLVGNGNVNVDILGTAQDRSRLALSEEIGVRKAYSASSEVEQDLKNGYDAVIDCSGHHSVPEQALKWLKRGGEIVLVGISTNIFSIPMDQIVRGEISIKGSYGITLENYKEVLDMSKNPAFPFEKIIADAVSFDNIIKGFEKALLQIPGKVVVLF